MTNDRDPTLQSLFNMAKEELAEEAFVALVMAEIHSVRRRAVMGWICVGLVCVICGWWLAWPLQDAAHALTQILPLTLIDLDIGWPSQFLAPMNSLAGLVALGFLALRRAYREIFP